MAEGCGGGKIEKVKCQNPSTINFEPSTLLCGRRMPVRNRAMVIWSGHTKTIENPTSHCPGQFLGGQQITEVVQKRFAWFYPQMTPNAAD
jgi:hypothetical protein